MDAPQNVYLLHTLYIYIHPNYSDARRRHPKRQLSTGISPISGNFRSVKDYNLRRLHYMFPIESYISDPLVACICMMLHWAAVLKGVCVYIYICIQAPIDTLDMIFDLGMHLRYVIRKLVGILASQDCPCMNYVSCEINFFPMVAISRQYIKSDYFSEALVHFVWGSLPEGPQ